MVSDRGWPKYPLGTTWRDKERLKKEAQWKSQICRECGLNVHYLKNGTLVHDNTDSAVRVAGIHLPWIEEKNEKESAVHKRKSS